MQIGKGAQTSFLMVWLLIAWVLEFNSYSNKFVFPFLQRGKERFQGLKNELILVE